MFNLENLKVLFVEDEISIRTNIKDAIGEEFALFETACDGQEGLEKYKALNPDIIITDISMPNLDGLQMINEIRKHSLTIPIIVLSAFSEKEKLFQAIDMSVCKYIVKPLDIDELLEVISDIANRFEKTQTVKLPMEYKYNITKKELFLNEKFISLTKKELLFIDILVKNKETYTPNEELYKYVWGNKTSGTTVRTFVQRLRNKTNKDLIVNVSGLGYRIFNSC